MAEDTGDTGEFDQSSDELGDEDAAIDANDDGAQDWDHEAYNEIDQGRWDDDPNPYEGTYSED